VGVREELSSSFMMLLQVGPYVWDCITFTKPAWVSLLETREGSYQGKDRYTECDRNLSLSSLLSRSISTSLENPVEECGAVLLGLSVSSEVSAGFFCSILQTLLLS